MIQLVMANLMLHCPCGVEKRVNPFIDAVRWLRYAIAMPWSVRIQSGGQLPRSGLINVLRPFFFPFPDVRQKDTDVTNQIPNSAIGAVASVISAHYYSHSTLDSLFMEAGAPGEAPEGNCEKKCSLWLRRCNDDPSVDAHEVLGGVIQNFMDMEPPPFGSHESTLEPGRRRIREALAKNQLSYQMNGFIVLAGSNPTTKNIGRLFQSRRLCLDRAGV